MNLFLFFRTGLAGLLFVQLMMLGCATTAPPVKTESAPVRLDKPKAEAEKKTRLHHFRAVAAEAENKGDLRLALLNWEVVSSLGGPEAEVASKISALKAQISSAALQHFNNGVDYYKRNLLYEARKEFLLTLNLVPENTEALGYLKYKLAGGDSFQYTVKSGDTLKGIAQKNFGDQKKVFLIAYFNNLTGDAKLEPGSHLIIPILEPSLMGKQGESAADGVVIQQTETITLPGKTFDAKGAMGEAVAFYNAQDYLKVIALTDKILKSSPTRKDARELKNAACYQRGKSLMKVEKHAESLKMFECVEPGYKDGHQLAASIRKRLAEAHYIRGIEFFMYDKLDEAIEQWKATLSIDPNHPKASSDIENARVMLKKLKEI